MKISVIFSPVMKVSCRERGPASEAGWLWGQGGGGVRSSRGRGGGPHLRLIDLQQHRPGSEATVVKQHVRQDGKRGRGIFQRPGLCLQRLLRVGGGP